MEKLQQLAALQQMVLMQQKQQLQVRQDEQGLQHLHDEFFRRFLFPLLVQDLRQVQMLICELGELHKHRQVVKLVQLRQLVPEAVSLVRTQLVPEAVSLVRTQLVPEAVSLVLVVELLEQKQIRTHRLIQDVLPLQQLYQLQRQSQEEFQQLVKEFQYQPCQ
jgi:hypothetical protein